MSQNMSTLEFLKSLRRLNIELSVEGDRLRCNAPKGALTSTLKAELSERKAEILTLLKDSQSQADLKIKPTGRKGILPLSFAQQRLWFLDQLDESPSSSYNMPLVLQLSGQLDIAALEKAIREIVRRHEVLRTKFEKIDRGPVQVIAPSVALTLPVVDLQSWPAATRQTEIYRIAKEAAHKPFNLAPQSSLTAEEIEASIETSIEKDGLIRAQLLAIDSASHVLIVVMHHIISDGWSMNIFTRELSVLYRNFSQQHPSSLPDLPIQYADFAYWQRQHLTPEVLSEQQRYWRQQLANAPELWMPPLDYPRPSMQTYEGSSISFQFATDLSEQVTVLAHQFETTLFVTLITAFSVLLHRFSQIEDLVIGTPVANRNRKEIEPLIGFFVNTLPIRVAADGKLTFSKLLYQMKKIALEAYSHQDLPFEKLVETLNPKRSLGHHPIFQVMFALQNTACANGELPGLFLEKLPLEWNNSKFDLSLSITESAEGMRGTWIYSTSLFKAETIKRLAEQFRTVLLSVVENPDQFIADIPLATVEGHRQIATTQALERKITNLSSAKRALLEQKIRQKRENDSHTKQRVISPMPQQADIPLSSAQQNLWLLDQITPGNPAYNRPTNIRFSGSLNIDILQKSLETIIQRHDSLRSYFVKTPEGEPVQLVAERCSLPIPQADLTHLSALAQKAVVNELAATEAQSSFDLSQSPLFKAKLLVLSDEEHILLLTFHHTVFDGWSMSVLLKELSTLYQALLRSEPCSLPTLPIQYADFAYWQSQQLKTNRLETQLTYWRKQLSGALPVLELPADRSRTAIKTFQGAKHSFVLTQDLKVKLIELSQRSEATLFMTLLTGFKVLLYRYTWADDILVGVPIAGRNHAETEGLIGLFVNTLVLRTSLQGDESFQTLLQQIRQVSLDAFSHADVPMQKLVEVLQLERDLGRSTLFQVLFQYRNLPESEAQIDHLKIDSCALETGVSALDISLEITEQADGLLCELKYNVDLFAATTIERMGEQFETLLTSAVDEPTREISLLTVLPQREQQLLRSWALPRGRAQSMQSESELSESEFIERELLCIHELFEAHAARDPETVAVEFAGESLAYQTLNSRANQVAHYLISTGLKPDELVGLCLERSTEMVVALLGVLKAGGAYVPLDPHYPSDRLAFMMADAQISVLLTQFSCLDTLPVSTASEQTVCLDRDWDAIAQQPQHNPMVDVSSESLAYIIYTSGSTGTPKGVMIQHDSLMNFTRAAQEEYGITERDRVLQFASISFDAAAEEIYPCLATGGTLVLRTEDMLGSVEQFLQTCREWQLTVLDLPTAYWQQIVSELIENSEVRLPEMLRLIIIGGERVAPDKIKDWQASVGDYPALINTYGPTETTVVATACAVTAQTNIENEVPIGRAIANVQTYVLDQQLQPMPIGVPGELHIGGSGLARGYLNRPDLSAERFINSRVQGSNVRLYKTGDLVRYLSNGEIEFLGRIDHQVKIRGFRIELGEIEATLSSHTQIRESVVISQNDKSGDRLIAYVVTHGFEQTDSIAIELRSFLQDLLPTYMIPAAFVPLQSLPLMPSGKIDRKALPAPNPSSRMSDNELIPPRNKTEQQLLQIWDELLDQAEISIHDDFFALGGHSLLATQVIARVRSLLAVDIPLRSLFESPTIAGLSQVISQIVSGDGSKANAQAIANKTQGVIERRLELSSYPLSFTQQLMWLVHQLESETNAYNMTKVSRLVGQLNVAALERSLGEIINRHEVLRSTFQTVDGQPVQTVAPVRPFELAIVDLQSLPQVERETKAIELASKAAQQTFDLAQGPLIHIQMIALGTTKHLLAINIHHIVFDGWSFGLFFNELSALYSAYCESVASPLTALPIQYADFASWQQQQAKTAAFQSQLNYWKQQLGGVLPHLQLPIDYPRPVHQDHRSASCSMLLSSELTTQLKTLSQQYNATLFMTLLTALNLLLHRQSGQDDIIVGTPIAGRSQVETEALIGLFLNSLALRTNLSDDPTFEQLLVQVRETTLNAYANQDIPFARLVQELNPERSLSRHPIFEVMLNLTNVPKAQWEMLGLSLSSVETGRIDSKFAMTLYVYEKEGQLRLLLVYQQALFSAARMNDLLAQYQKLLAQVVQVSDKPISAYDLVSEQAAKILPNPSVPIAVKDYEPTTSTIFRWAERSPYQAAIYQSDRCWTYEELAEGATAIAHTLRSQGLRTGATVAVLGDRSFGLIASILGVLRAGGVLLLLDPQLPVARQRVMLKEAKAEGLLLIQRLESPTLPDAVASLEALTSTEALWRYAVTPQTAECSLLSKQVPAQDSSLPTLRADDPAYIFFTSGTTGIPKGVLGCHKGLSHFLSWQRETFEVGPTDRVSQLTNLSFDVVLRDIFLPLTSGASLCLPMPDMDLSAKAVFAWLESQQITVVHTVPTLTKMWLMERAEDTASLPMPKYLRWLFLAGEPLSDRLVNQWRAAFPNIGKIVNLYGPTETTLAKCYYRVPEAPVVGTQPIGQPISETQALILSSSNQLGGIGEIGEIVLRSPFATLGYINAPQEQQQHFRLNPYTADPNDKVFYTGDWGRYRPDGTIEILGRQDHQVKIRGVRIEPGEIEAALLSHSMIREAAVLARKATSGEKSLTAYVVPVGANKLSEQSSKALSANELESIYSVSLQDLRQHLRQSLPAFVLPSAIIFLSALPLTPNGKINRQALPEPKEHQHSSATFVTPQTATEAELCQIWTKLLKLEEVGIYDNFFELGGHSLLATQVMARVRESFSVALPLRALFEAPTVSGLSKAIEQQAQSAQQTAQTEAESDLPKIVPRSRQRHRGKRSSRS